MWEQERVVVSHERPFGWLSGPVGFAQSGSFVQPTSATP